MGTEINWLAIADDVKTRILLLSAEIFIPALVLINDIIAFALNWTTQKI